MSDDLVTWLQQAVGDQHAELMDAVDCLASWVEFSRAEDPDHSEVLEAALRTEVEAKRARIDLLAQVASGAMILGSHANQEAEQAFALRVLHMEAQPLAGRPGFRDEWRLT